MGIAGFVQFKLCKRTLLNLFDKLFQLILVKSIVYFGKILELGGRQRNC